MTLDFQVTSLEISKRLKELGVEQKSLFWWLESVLEMNKGHAELWYGGSPFPKIGHWSVISALTVAELGEMLPAGMWYEKTMEDKRWRCGFIKDLAQPIKTGWQFGDTEADARGKMLIYLLENKII